MVEEGTTTHQETDGLQETHTQDGLDRDLIQDHGPDLGQDHLIPDHGQDHHTPDLGLDHGQGLTHGTELEF